MWLPRAWIGGFYTGMIPLQQLVSPARQRQTDMNFGTAPGCGDDVHPAANLFCALAHAEKSDAISFARIGGGGWIEASTVITHLDSQRLTINVQRDEEMSSLGMLDGIGQRLLNDSKRRHLHVQRKTTQIRIDVEIHLYIEDGSQAVNIGT